MSAAPIPKFDGETFARKTDGPRLTGQLARVRKFMADGEWHTLAGIAMAVGGSEAGVSARLRDLRKARFGAVTVERRRKDPESGLWEYRVFGHRCEAIQCAAHATCPTCDPDGCGCFKPVAS